jgi:tRNA uridine 5-carbamoylmethylation protein Kti12
MCRSVGNFKKLLVVVRDEVNIYSAMKYDRMTTSKMEYQQSTVWCMGYSQTGSNVC